MNILQWFKKLFNWKENNPKDTMVADAFIKTWSVIEFSKKYGKMQLCKSPDKNNRESYLKCRFIDKRNTSTYVTVSSRMQSITKKEVSENKDRIRIGQLLDGKYVLYDFRWKDWEDVNLS